MNHPNQSISADSGQHSYPGTLALLTSLFFIWGFLTCLNDILIPHLKAVFILNYAQTMLIQFCFFTAYFVVSIPSGYVVKRIGYKGGIIGGLVIASIGCLLFYPAAALRLYSLFLAALFVLASGITLLQVAANPYVTLLGKPETASSRLTMTQAFNSLGTTIAPYFGALFILATAVKTPYEITLLDADALAVYQAAEAASVQQPYLLLAAALLAVAIIFAIVKLPQAKAWVMESNITGTSFDTAYANVWCYPHLILGAIGIFVYVGAEVSIGSFLVSFLTEPTVTGLSVTTAAKYVTFYWGGAMVGRFIGAAVMQKIQPNKVLSFNAMTAASLVIATIFTHGTIAMWTILSVGLFNSIMFPTIFSLAIRQLGKHTGQGSGILCAAIVGGAVLPVVQGLMADQIGVHKAFFIPAICYAYIVFYGLKGSSLHAKN
jgi:FHS family L-fucose permease-like MFS transporter